MAREPMRVEIVCPREHEDERAHLAVKCLLCGNPRSARGRRFTATLAPGSRSEKVQRLGEAQLELAEAEAAGDAVVTEEHYDAWLARMGKAINNQLTALAALRQHDTEHGRTDGTDE